MKAPIVDPLTRKIDDLPPLEDLWISGDFFHKHISALQGQLWERLGGYGLNELGRKL